MTTAAQTRASRSNREMKTMFGYLTNLPLILSAVVALSAAIYFVFLYLMAHQ